MRFKALSSLALGIGIAVLAIPAHAQDDPRQKFPQVSTMSPLGVDLQSGRYVKEGVDLAIGPISVDHYVKRVMPAPLNGNFPPPVYATSLHGYSDKITMTGTGGSVVTTIHVHIGKLYISFNVNANGSFFPIDSSTTGWKMVTSGATYVLTNKSGDEYRFDTHAALVSTKRRLTSMTSANGHKLSYTYDASARVRTVTSNRGYAAVLDYSGNNVVACGYNLTVNEVNSSSTCAASNLKVTYTLDSLGKLLYIRGVDGADTGIQYITHQGSPYVSCVTKPASTTCAVTNTYTGVGSGGQNPDQVTKQVTAAGASETWNYTHVPVDNAQGDYVPGFGEIRESLGAMVPPLGAGTTAVYKNGFVSSINSPTGITNYEYSTQGAYAILYKSGWTGPHYYSVYPSKITYAEGNYIQFTRDYADNITTRLDVPKSGSTANGNLTTWAYPTAYKWSSPTICAAANVLCDKPTMITDPKGNVTTNTYDGTHGGILTKTGPAVNGIAPQTRYTYVQRNAMIKSGSSFVAMQPAIWVLASEEYCKTTAASGSGCAGGAADEVVTTYDYGPTSGANNLLLRGTVADANGLALRTCTTYDQYGRKLSTTQPKGTGASCP